MSRTRRKCYDKPRWREWRKRGKYLRDGDCPSNFYSKEDSSTRKEQNQRIRQHTNQELSSLDLEDEDALDSLILEEPVGTQGWESK